MSFDFSSTPSLRAIYRPLEFESEPKVTIVTPFYNSHEHIEETAKSVLSQTMREFEWIIVNDGSTSSESISILNQLEKRDKRIRVVSKQNGGLSSARNLGFKEAKSSYVVPLDSDDLIEPTFIEQCWFSLMAYPEAAWAYTDSVGFGDHEYIWIKNFDVDNLKKDNFLVATAMIRKEAWESVGGYDEELKSGYEDWHFWMKLLSKNNYPVHLKYIGFWYRRRPNSMLRVLHKEEDYKKYALKKIEDLAKQVKDIPVIELGSIDFNRWNSNKLEFTEEKNGHENKIKESKRTILFLFPWLNMGGADKFNLDLIEGLNKENHRLIICTTVPSNNQWEDRFAKYTDEIYHLPNFLPISEWTAFLKNKIVTDNVDILFISNSEFGYYSLPWLKENVEKPFVSVDFIHMEEKYWKNGGYARFSTEVEDYLDKTYISSNFLKETLIAEYGRNASNLDIVYTNNDAIKVFNPALFEYGAIKSELNIPEETPIIIFPCRLHNQKRPLFMVEIASKLKQKGLKFCIWVVGDGPEEQKIKDRVKESGLEKEVLFLGAVRDVRPYYKDADIMLICSIKEGLALTTFESMAMEVPVVTSDVGGQKELVTNETGFVLPLMVNEALDFGSENYSEKEINQYVITLTEMISDKQKTRIMGSKSRERILKHFLLDDMVKYFEQDFSIITKNYSKNSPGNKRLAYALLSMYIELLKAEKVSNDIWESRCYFERLANEKMIIKTAMSIVKDDNIKRKIKLFIKNVILKRA